MKQKNILMLFLFCLMASGTMAQKKGFAVMEYMHVKPGQNNAYLQTEQFWKKIHQQRQKNGHIYYWSVWQVVAPYALDAKYQYVVVTIYPKFSDYLDSYKDVDLKKVFSGMPEDSVNYYLRNTENTRDMVNSSVYEIMDHEWQSDSPDYAVVKEIHASPGKEKDYEELELETWKPIHANLQKNGLEAGYDFYKLIFPAEASNPYNYAFAEFFDNPESFDKWDKIDWPKYQKEYPAAFNDVDKIRTDVHTELLHRVLSVDK